MPTIYYIRHGETAWNAAGRFQGGQDIPLNERGHEQAARAGEILRVMFGRDGSAAASLSYVASPLGRARRTMELVRDALKLSPEGYAIDERLREVSYGRWEGLTSSEIFAADPELFAAREQDKWRVAAPGGESYAAMAERVRDWVGSLASDTVTVGHVGTGRSLMVALGIETAASAAERTIEQGVVYAFDGNGGVMKYS